MVPHLKNQLFSASIIKYLYVTEAEAPFMFMFVQHMKMMSISFTT